MLFAIEQMLGGGLGVVEVGHAVIVMMVRHVLGMGQYMRDGKLAVGIKARGMRIAALRCMDELQRQAQHQE